MRAGALLASLAVLVALSGCEPEKGRGKPPPAGGGRDPVVAEGDCRARAYLPEASRPRPDGPGFYQFTSTGEGAVTCSRRMHQIKVTAIFQHQTNSSRRGAVTGRDALCHDALTCDGEATYTRTRLNCATVYRYDDYTQLTGWYVVAPGGPQIRIDSVDSRHRVGTSHKPREVCR